MPKKSNAFASFMFQLKKKLNLSDMSDIELQIIAGEKWAKMDVNERAVYGCKQTERKRLNCLGQSIDDENRKVDEKRKNEEKIISTIAKTIQQAVEKDPMELYDLEFYFFCSSHFVKKRGEDVFPAEIALAKFSLREGIIDTLHMRINPGKLPLGMASEAINHAKKSHRFELPPNTEGEKDYKIVLDRILEFIGVKKFTSEFVPPFYVYCGYDVDGDDFEGTELTLNKIAEESGHPNAFRAFKAEELFFCMHKHVVSFRNERDRNAHAKEFASIVQAADVMRRDDHRYSEIGCCTHNDDDNSTNCCLSKVQRLGFSFVKYCLDDSFELIPGKHYPASFKKYIDFDDFNELSVSESFHQLTLNTTASRTNTLSSLPSVEQLNSSNPSLTQLESKPSRLRFKIAESVIESETAKGNNSWAANLAKTHNYVK